VTIATLLQTADGKAALKNLSSAFGIDSTAAEPAVASLATALANRIQRNMISRGGVADIAGLLIDSSAGRAATDSSSLASLQVAETGNHVLDVLIGDKHVSRGIAARTAAETGIDEGLAKKLLPVVASMLVGNLQKQAAPQLTKLMRDLPQRAVSNPGNPLPIPGDDIPGVGRNAPRTPSQSPDNPFENLPDIIRRGGTQVPGGGSLEDVIRSILGGLLGFKNRGMIGNIVQALVIRWIVNLVRRFLGGR
jgi:hypothetical protein